MISEEVYSQYSDTAGNYHWIGTNSGHHIIYNLENLTNFTIPKKCWNCGWMYNYQCRKNSCVYEEKSNEK